MLFYMSEILYACFFHSFSIVNSISATWELLLITCYNNFYLKPYTQFESIEDYVWFLESTPSHHHIIGIVDCLVID